NLVVAGVLDGEISQVRSLAD
ncbi:hypothetical protein EVA_19253, partial [gut metagenome]